MLVPGVGRMGIWDDGGHRHQTAGLYLTSAPAVTPELPSRGQRQVAKGEPCWHGGPWEDKSEKELI